MTEGWGFVYVGGGRIIGLGSAGREGEAPAEPAGDVRTAGNRTVGKDSAQLGSVPFGACFRFGLVLREAGVSHRSLAVGYGLNAIPFIFT